MYPTGTRIGYSLASRDASTSSFGLRFTNTILDSVFIAKYSAPLSQVAFWVRSIIGTPQRSSITLTLYQDGGSIANPGTLIETVSGGSGAISTGRLVFSGFTSSLVKGRRYRLRLTTSNNQDNNFPEILLAPYLHSGDFNESPFCSDFWQLRWQGSDSDHHAYNMQVFQTVNSQSVSRDVLVATVGDSITYAYTSYNNSPFGVRFTAPPGKNLRYLGLVVNRMTMVGAAAYNSYWQVKYQGDIICTTGVFPGFAASTIPDSTPYWGLWLYRFTEPLVLEAGKTYDFIFAVAGSHDASNYATLQTINIDSTYVPSWLQRYQLLVGGSVVSSRVLPTFMLVLDDAQPLPGESGGIINPYVMLPVG